MKKLILMVLLLMIATSCFAFELTIRNHANEPVVIYLGAKQNDFPCVDDVLSVKSVQEVQNNTKVIVYRRIPPKSGIMVNVSESLSGEKLYGMIFLNRKEFGGVIIASIRCNSEILVFKKEHPNILDLPKIYAISNTKT